MLRNLETRNRRTPLPPPLGPDGPGRRNSAIGVLEPTESWRKDVAPPPRTVVTERCRRCQRRGITQSGNGGEMLGLLSSLALRAPESAPCWLKPGRSPRGQGAGSGAAAGSGAQLLSLRRKRLRTGRGGRGGGWRITAYILAQVFIWRICPS